MKTKRKEEEGRWRSKCRGVALVSGLCLFLVLPAHAALKGDINDPKVQCDDIELAPYEVAVVQLDDVLLNFSEEKTYEWSVSGTPQHVSFSINPLTRTVTVTSLDDWNGAENFTLSCREKGTTYIGFSPFQVILGTGEQSLGVVLRRDEFRWVTGREFSEAPFAVLNASGPVAVSAWIRYPDSTWHQVMVRNDATGETGSGIDIRGTGHVVWPGGDVGNYVGRVDVRDATEPEGTVDDSSYFSVELINPGVDSDGDRFFLVYKHDDILYAYAENFLAIKDGQNSDTLGLVVYKGPMGNGRVDLDFISSDHGFKKIKLRGSVKSVRTSGPLGILEVTGGMVGEVIVSNGTIGGVVVKNIWDADAEMFADAGIVRGVYAERGIGVIAVYGGAIGASDAPAKILADTGNIKSITTKQMKKAFCFPGDTYTELAAADGAHIYATIRAPQGSIGSVTAGGGTIGTPQENEPCTIEAAATIGKVNARSDVSDGFLYGGSVCANIRAGTSIASINAVGGDIARNEVLNPEDIGELDNLPVQIVAPKIFAIKSTARIVNEDMWNSVFGGSIHADITAPSSFGSLEVKGGNARLWLHASSIKSISVKALSYKECPSDLAPLLRGGTILSSIIATTAVGGFRSSDPGAYDGTIGKLTANGGIKDSWTGFRSSTLDDQFDYTEFVVGQCVNTEFWEVKGSTIHVVQF